MVALEVAVPVKHSGLIPDGSIDVQLADCQQFVALQLFTLCKSLILLVKS